MLLIPKAIMKVTCLIWAQRIIALSLSTIFLFQLFGAENQCQSLKNRANYSMTDRAYLAGFFDGDGAIMAIIERTAEKRFGYRIRLQAKITQKGREILDELQNLFGIGRVKVFRAAHEWYIKDRQAVLFLIDLIIPYSRVKYNQLLLAKQIAVKLEHVNTKEDLGEIVRLAYSLSSYNVRSKRRPSDKEIIIKAIEERGIKL